MACATHEKRPDDHWRSLQAVSWWQAVLIFLAGLWAGTINTVVGSGTLVTFPVLVTVGYPPVTATTSNAIGLIFGTVAGTIGYRRELAGQRARVMRLAVASFLGAVLGTVLLLSLPPTAFETIVPVLILFALALVVLQSRISAWLGERREKRHEHGGLAMWIGTLLVGVYGGYFTAAQGIMLLAIGGLFLTESLQRLNALKNVLAGVVNTVAGIIYAFLAPVSWPVVAILAVSSTLGGMLGAKIGRRLPPQVLRAVIVVVGLAAVIKLLLD